MIVMKPGTNFLGSKDMYFQWLPLSDYMYEGTPSATISPDNKIVYWFGFTGVSEIGNNGSTNIKDKEHHQRPALFHIHTL